MRELYLEFIVVSAERDFFDEKVNARRTQSLESYLDAVMLPYLKAEGRWEGKTEKSFVVFTSQPEELAKTLMKQYEQDSVLCVGADRTATLLHNNSNHTLEPIGKWMIERCCEDEKKTNYTIVGGHRYVCG